MPSDAPAPRRTARRALVRDRRIVGSFLIGASAAAAVFASLAAARAVPDGSRPLASTVWALLAVAIVAVGAALWLLTDGRPRWRPAAAAAAVGLVATLVLTAAVNPAQWRSIAGHPDNSPSAFYRESSVGELVARLVEYAADRPILGLYLSNHYESSVIVPLAGGPVGSTGGEIISVLPDGDTRVVQTKLSPGIAAAEGIDPAEVDPAVLGQVAAESARIGGLDDRDEVRVQVERRDGVTEYAVLTRKRGADQPWLRFDLQGDRLD